MSRGKLLKPMFSSQKSKSFKNKMIFTDVTGISIRLLTLSRIEQLNRLSRGRCFINEWSRLITSREFYQNELIPSPTVAGSIIENGKEVMLDQPNHSYILCVYVVSWIYFS
ncbi:hypothetical protein V1478_017128 [Vespula squamosa]|uniref:Uncharacterized protein n=1 Tax=Vespula squamosa TaxID=30214 RepID=A0ABD1ZYH6_VESSQ